jgi:hypothetical protein
VEIETKNPRLHRLHIFKAVCNLMCNLKKCVCDCIYVCRLHKLHTYLYRAYMRARTRTHMRLIFLRMCNLTISRLSQCFAVTQKCVTSKISVLDSIFLQAPSKKALAHSVIGVTLKLGLGDTKAVMYV